MAEEYLPFYAMTLPKVRVSSAEIGLSSTIVVACCVFLVPITDDFFGVPGFERSSLRELEREMIS